MTFNIETATVQEAVDYSVQQIVKQGGQCMAVSGVYCAYKSQCGKQHCAIGWLLDHNDDYLMNHGSGIIGLLMEKRDLIPVLIQNNEATFGRLQSFHDERTVGMRKDKRTALGKLGINTDGEWFDQWINMATF